jgi:hypothetical protein
VRTYQRGAYPSPWHVIAAAKPHQLRANVPASFGIVPSQLSMWLNDVDGDCVTAEEAFAKAVWSLMCGLPELFIPDSVVQSWASSNGFLNGADLPSVMAAMAKSGFVVNGTDYTDGPPESVDYTNWATLTSAISSGPVKIGVDADDIEEAVNTTNGASGWFGTGWTDTANQDHCTSLSGYGTVAQCYGFLGLPIPAAAQSSSSQNAVLLYTWKSIGVVLYPSLLGVTSEAWLRTPTTPQQVPTPGPSPTPGPTPTPVPGPTPTPVPAVPATAVWIDKPSKTYFLPTGWTQKTNNLGPEFEVHPGLQELDVPTKGGWAPTS